jgi:hypothetical protein
MATLSVNATSANSPITATVDASSIGGSSTTPMPFASGSTYSANVTVGGSVPGGVYLLPVTITDGVTVNYITLTVNVISVNEVWAGGGNGLWSNGPDWVSGFGPISGDTVTFATGNQLLANMQSAYALNWLSFNSTAGAFVITNDGTHSLTLNGNVTNSSTSTETIDVPVILGGNVTLNAAAGNVTYGSSVSGNYGITSLGLTNNLAGSSSYQGATVVGSGELLLSGTDLLYGSVTVSNGATLAITGNGGSQNSFTINNGGTLLISGSGQINNGIYEPAIVNNGTIIYASTNSPTSNYTNANGLNLLGVISGSGSLVVNSGTLTLGESVNPGGGIGGYGKGADAYTGSTIVNGGTLNLFYDNPGTGALITSTNITINSGGAVVALLSSALQGYSTQSAAAYPITINAGGLLDVSPTYTVVGNGFSGHIQGVLNLNGGTISNNASFVQQYGGWTLYNTCFVNGGTNTSFIADKEFGVASTNAATGGTTAFIITSGGTQQTVPGVDLDVTGNLISSYGTADTGIAVGGNGTMRLDGLNTYIHGTIVSNGATLILGVNGQLNTVVNTGNGSTSTDFGSAAAQANVPNGGLGGTIYSGVYSGPMTINGTFISTTTNTTAFSITSTNTRAIQTLNGALTGAGLFEVSGAQSQLILAVGNAFTGSIVVTNGGILYVTNTSGSVGTAPASLNVYSGGTLAGGGTIGAAATNNSGGTLAPGYGKTLAGTTLTFTNGLTLLAGSTTTLQVNHNAETSDKIASPVQTTYGGTLTVTTNAGDAPFAAGDTFTLFNFGANTPGGTFSATNLPALGPNLFWNVNLNLGTISVVGVTAPMAGFSGAPTSVFVNQNVVFTSSSTGTITNYSWTYGDGGTLSTASGSPVTHAYATAGTKNVSLTVTGPLGANTATSNSYITVYPSLSLASPTVSGGVLSFSGTGGIPGVQYRVLNSTNLGAALATWTPVYTNTFTGGGGYSYSTSPLTNKTSFYIITSP